MLLLKEFFKLSSSKHFLLFFNKHVFTVSLKSNAKPARWRAIPGWLFMTAYSIFFQLTSISGGLLPNPRSKKMHHAVVTGTHGLVHSVNSTMYGIQANTTKEITVLILENTLS